MMATYRILSLDGGGLRGLISARLLQRLNDEPAIAGWLDSVDLFAGTSTGGILALGLADGRPPEEIVSLYKDRGKKIFKDDLWDDFRDLGRTVGAEYSHKGLEKELKNIFENKTLADLPKRVAIPTFDLDNKSPIPEKRSWKPKIFHNFTGDDSDGVERAADVALYTSLAPTFFPSVDGYIDGGVFANNPSIVAISQVISHKNTPLERADLNEIVLLSVGTGVSLKYINGKKLDWGYAQWAKPLLNILMDGVAGVSDYQAQQLLGDRYRRLQIIFKPNESIPLDAVDKVEEMDDIASNFELSGVVDWIKSKWQG